MECISIRSKNHCTCTYTTCDKHGNCCQCVLYHRAKDEIPGCFFTPSGERSYNRSVVAFRKDQGF